jgi:hypothetical protein
VTAKKWDVWSIDRKDCSGLVVVDGVSEKEARDAADRKNASAARHGMPMLAFAALPQGQKPAWGDLPPLPEPPPARNEQPLHDHEGVNAGPRTANTMAAHLVNLHGVDGVEEGLGLPELILIHNHLNHGQPARKPAPRADGPGPGCRYSRIYWGKLRTSDNPADRDLYLESDNGTSIVCFSPGDVQALRAAVLPESQEMARLQDKWSAKLGPGGRTAVAEGHMQGYRLGVEDMENTPVYRTAPADADAVISFLTGLAGTAAAIRGGKLDALGTVTEFLEQMKARSGDEADRG